MKQAFLIACCLAACLCRAQTEIRCHNMSWEGSLATTKVSNIVQDRKGYLWFGTLNGLFRYDGYRFKAYRQEGNGQITKLYHWDDGRLLVQLRGEHYRLFCLDSGRFDTLATADQSRKETLLAPPAPTVVPDSLRSKCRRLFWDNKKNVVADDGSGRLRWVDRRTGEVVALQVYPQPLLDQGNNPYYSVVSDEKRHLLWVSTSGNGLFAYDRTTHRLQHYGRSSQRQTGIDTDLFTSMMMDSDGNLWVCKDNAPPACITVLPQGVSQLPLMADRGSERANEVKTLRSIGSGWLLAGSNNGDNYLTQADWMPALIKELNGIDLIAACRHPLTGDLLLGARHHGIRIGGKWYRPDAANPASLGYRRVNDILVDTAGRIWLAVLNGGLDLAVADDGSGYSFRHFFTENSRIQTGRRLVQDDRGRIWYGTGDGLFSFMPDSLVADKRKYRYYPLDERGISEIHDLLLDSHGRLWVCTHGQGVFVLDTKTDSIRQLTTRDGLVYDATQSAVEDAGGRVWIGTVNGLSSVVASQSSLFTPHASLPIANYHFAAMPRGNFFSEAAAVCADGQLLFGTLDGVLRIQPSTLMGAGGGGLRHVAVTDVLADGESRGNRLPHDTQLATFCFSDFGFAAHESARYVYRLEDYDRGWSQPTTESEATYRRLPPGKYTFRVRLYEGNGLQSHGDTTAQGSEGMATLTVLPPWWRTWWAYLIYILMATLLGYIMFRQVRQMARLRMSLRVERQLTDYKLRFFTNISHEFRTPLTLIQGSMEHLQAMEDEVPARLKQPLGAMNRSARRLLRLINQLLEFRKMQNDRLELHVQETDVVEFVRDVCQNFRDAADSKGISLQLLPAVRSFNAFIDRSHVDKMVYNLLSNALKYTPRGGSVTVYLRFTDLPSTDLPSTDLPTAHSQFTISVADTGVGIPKKKQPELFSRYMQSTFLGDSMGIGLNLTQELARVHHGIIKFEENPQGGSIFTIELPADKSAYADGEFLVVKQEIATEQPAETTAWLADYRELAPVPMNDCRVLVVEDDSDVQLYLKQQLQPYFQVETANDGEEALKLIEDGEQKTKRYDLVITDVRMPRMDGYELIRRIRKEPQLSSLPIILLTAVTGEGQEAKGIGRGADVYLPKPFSVPTLISYCRRLIERSHNTSHSSHNTSPSSLAPHPSPLTSTIITDQRDHRFMEKLDAWIDLHLQEAISTEDMAAAMDVGRTTLFDKLRQLTGMSPARYVQQRKMECAKQMLREGGMTTKQIAYSIGFDDPHYFSIRFKALFGVTPTEFAKSQ